MDVVAYEVDIGDLNGRPAICDYGGQIVCVVPMAASNRRIVLEDEIVDEKSTYVDDFSSTATIFHFKGFWPSLSDLHAWIFRVWEPFILGTTQIYPMARGFFIVKFDSIEDRNAILWHGFSWGEKFPLMAKPWNKDFDPSTESFNKIPLWVRLSNLPLHLWLDSVLEAVGDALKDFLIVDTASSNVFHTTYARILVEIDISKGLLEKIMLDSSIGSWIQLLNYEGIPFRCRKCHKTGQLAAVCSSEKSRSKKSPWWKGVSDEHYTVQNAPSTGDVGSSQDTLVADSTVVSNGMTASPLMVTSFALPLLDSISCDLTVAPPRAPTLDVAAPSQDC